MQRFPNNGALFLVETYQRYFNKNANIFCLFFLNIYDILTQARSEASKDLVTFLIVTASSYMCDVMDVARNVPRGFLLFCGKKLEISLSITLFLKTFSFQFVNQVSSPQFHEDRGRCVGGGAVAAKEASARESLFSFENFS